MGISQKQSAAPEHCNVKGLKKDLFSHSSILKEKPTFPSLSFKARIWQSNVGHRCPPFALQTP